VRVADAKSCMVSLNSFPFELHPHAKVLHYAAMIASGRPHRQFYFDLPGSFRHSPDNANPKRISKCNSRSRSRPMAPLPLSTPILHHGLLTAANTRGVNTTQPLPNSPKDDTAVTCLRNTRTAACSNTLAVQVRPVRYTLAVLRGITNPACEQHTR
jgi:hypothetical protein